MDYIQLKWRVGENLRRAIFAVVPDTEHDDHPLLGLMDTPELAVEVVSAHNREAVAAINKTTVQMTFGEKELLVKDLQSTVKNWENHQDVEAAIMTATAGGVRAARVYTAIGKSTNILGQDTELPDVVRHAINIIRSQ